MLLLFSAMPMTVFAADDPQSPAATAPLGKGASELAPTGAAYDLWLGTTQVTDENKDDILNDGGKAKFDPSTGTLTLDNPTINSFYVNGYGASDLIYAEDFNLKIVGSYTYSGQALPDRCIDVLNGDLTLDGDFVFRSTSVTVGAFMRNSSNRGGALTIAGGSVDVNSDTHSGIYADKNITVSSDVEYVKAIGGTYAGTTWPPIRSEDGMITVQNPLRIVSPEGGVIIGGRIYESDGKTGASRVEIVNPNYKKYDLWVGATQVTSKNKDDILNDGGKAKFDPDTNTLTLDSPTIPDVYEDYNGSTSKIFSDYMDLTVKGTYKMTEEETDSGIYCYWCSLTLSGTFTFFGKYTAVDVDKTLTIGGNSLTAKSSEGIGIEADDITIGSVRTLTAECLDDGICSNGRITINGAGTVFAKSGNGTGLYAEGSIKIDSVNTLTVEGRQDGIHATQGSITFSGGTVSARGSENDGIYAGEDITINSGVTYVYGEGGVSAIGASSGKIVISRDLTILAPIGGIYRDGEIYESNGSTIAKYAKIGKPEKYDLWLGSTQVTDSNKSDILNDGGKAKYDSVTKTLTLNDPTISGSYNDGYCAIYSELDNLTITGKATINLPDLTVAVVANGLKLNGDFSFTADENTVFVPDGNMTVENSTLTLCAASGGDAIDVEDGDLIVKNSSITTVDAGIWVSGNVKTENSTLDVDTYFSDNGIFAAEGITFVNSSVTVSGTPKYGVLANDGALTVSNSTVDAYGSEIGVVGRKTISISGYQTNITARGGVIGILATQNIMIDSTTGYLQANGSSRAIGSNGLELGSGLSITDSNGKALQKSGNKIVNAGGSEATDVVIKNPNAPSGYTVSGSFTSYLDASGSVSVQLMQSDSVKYSAKATGNTGSYSIANVAAGSYTLRVSKANHVTRDYAITVSGNKTQDVKICPLGDVNGDGKITNYDYSKVNQHVCKIEGKELSGYAFSCADVNSDGKITNYDAGKINQHVCKVKELY